MQLFLLGKFKEVLGSRCINSLAVDRHCCIALNRGLYTSTHNCVRVLVFCALASLTHHNKILVEDGGGIGKLSRKCQISINLDFCSTWIHSFIHSANYIEQLLKPDIVQGTINIVMMKIEDLLFWSYLLVWEIKIVKNKWNIMYQMIWRKSTERFGVPGIFASIKLLVIAE